MPLYRLYRNSQALETSHLPAKMKYNLETHLPIQQISFNENMVLTEYKSKAVNATLKSQHKGNKRVVIMINYGCMINCETEQNRCGEKLLKEGHRNLALFGRGAKGAQPI